MKPAFAFLCCALLSLPAYAVKPVGEATFSFLFWDIYHSTLSSEDGVYDPAKPHQLENEYVIDFSKQELLKTTQEELFRVSDVAPPVIAQWVAWLDEIYPESVQEGDVIRAEYDGQKRVVLYYNDARSGHIEDAAFARAFMGIWLSDKSRDQAFTRQLTNLQK